MAAAPSSRRASRSHRRTRPADQAWFWTSAWRAGKRAAGGDLAAGRTERFDSDDAFAERLAAIPLAPADDPAA